MKRDVAATLARVAAIGYREVEFAGYFDRSAADLRALLVHDRLRAPSSHVPLPTLRNDPQQTFDDAHTLGLEYVTVAWIPEEERRSLDDVKRVVDSFNQIGAKAKAAGLRFAFHNHDYEFKPVGGRLLYDELLAGTDPSLVVFEADLYWMTKGGADPLVYFAKHPGRFELVHVKDSKGPPRHEMTEVGHGIIDWKSILAHSRQAGIRHVFVEQDDSTDPLASIRASYHYLSQLEF